MLFVFDDFAEVFTKIYTANDLMETALAKGKFFNCHKHSNPHEEQKVCLPVNNSGAITHYMLQFIHQRF